MNRVLAFSGRNLKELLRDPLSYIFCLGFPLVMLVIMSIVNQSIPPEAGMTIFNIENLAGGYRDVRAVVHHAFHMSVGLKRPQRSVPDAAVCVPDEKL